MRPRLDTDVSSEVLRILLMMLRDVSDRHSYVAGGNTRNVRQIGRIMGDEEKVRNSSNYGFRKSQFYFKYKSIEFYLSGLTVPSRGSSSMCCMTAQLRVMRFLANSSSYIVTLNTFAIYSIRSTRSFLRSFLRSSHFDLFGSRIKLPCTNYAQGWRLFF